MFSNFEYYLKIKNLLYPNQEPVDVDKTFRSKCKFKKKIIFVDDFFLYEIFSNKRTFFYVEILVKYMKLSIPCMIWEILKKWFQQNLFYFHLNLS